MSREACTKCGSVVSTTADPNPYQGVFLSLDQVDELEAEIDLSETPEANIWLRGVLKKLRVPRLVLCADCRPTELF